MPQSNCEAISISRLDQTSIVDQSHAEDGIFPSLLLERFVSGNNQNEESQLRLETGFWEKPK